MMYLDDHAKYHEMDLMDAKREELKKKMTEVINFGYAK